jgi:hypothetical protein
MGAGNIDWGAAASGAGAGAGIGTAIAPGIGTVVGGAIGFFAPLIGQLIGNALGQGDRDKAQKILENAYNQFGPDILKAPGVKELTPHLDTSAMANVHADPSSIAAEQSALTRLMRYGEQGPDNIEFRAQQDAANRGANQQAAAQNAMLRNEMQARGRGNSGAEYAARALENQSAAERASAGGFAAAQSADERALQALATGSGLASRIRGESFGEAATKANAADDFAKWNEEGRVHGAQAAYDNRLRGAVAQSNAGANLANYYTGNAANVQNMATNIGQGVGQGAAELGNYFDSQRKKKPGPWAGGYDSGEG